MFCLHVQEGGFQESACPKDRLGGSLYLYDPAYV